MIRRECNGKLIFARHTAIPVSLVILPGRFLRRAGMLNEGFNKTADQLFRCAPPVTLWLFALRRFGLI